MNEKQAHATENENATEERMGKDEIGCLAFVIVLVSVAVILVMRMFIPEVGFWKAILYTAGFFAVVAVFAGAKILFSERVVAPIVGASEQPDGQEGSQES